MCLYRTMKVFSILLGDFLWLEGGDSEMNHRPLSGAIIQRRSITHDYTLLKKVIFISRRQEASQGSYSCSYESVADREAKPTVFHKIERGRRTLARWQLLIE